MSHTPGPWTLDECSNGGMLLVRPPLTGQKHAVQSHLQILPTEDAYLIAAAPELLSLLKQILAGFEEHGRFSINITGTQGIEEIVPFSRLLLDAKAVIAKAEGK